MLYLIDELKRNNIDISLNGDDLDLSFDSSEIDVNLLKEVKQHKKELIDFLKKYASLTVKHDIVPIATSSSYALSNAQRRLWFASQMEEGSIAYNIPDSMVLDGTYDIDCFQKAIHAVIDRHEILRTIFKIEETTGEVRQYVLSSAALGFKIEYKDFRGEGDAVAAARSYIAIDSDKPFDLATGPLLRASLIQCAADSYIFYYNLHHIISDGWSMGVLSREVMQFYEGYAGGTPPSLPPLRIQYKDYAAWQLEQLNSGSYEAAKEYWLSQLSGELGLLDLPSEQRRPAVKSYQGRRIAARLSPALTARLRAFTSSRRGSLFAGLLAVWKVLLYRYTGSKDIIIGNPISGRDHANLEDQIGFYVNTLVLRTKLDPQASFSSFFDQVKEVMLSAYEHQQYPFDKLLEDMSVRRDAARSLVFDVLVDYHGVSAQGLSFAAEDKLEDLGSSLVKFDLEFDPTEVGGGVDLLFAYNVAVYDQKMIEGLILHYKDLLSLLLDDPEVCIGKVNFLSKGEVAQQLSDFNSSSIDYPEGKTVVDLFAAQALKSPDATAVVYEAARLSYGELDKLTNQLARYLQSRGVGAGDLVPICVDSPLEMIIGLLGILKAGAAYVPIDSNCPEQRLAYILEDIGSTQLLTHSDLADLFDAEAGVLELFCLDQCSSLLSDISNLPLTKQPRSTDLVYVIYTSGTTGVPKGVLINHESLMDYVYGLLDQLAIKESYAYGLMSTPSADLGNTVLFSSLVTGGVLHTFSKATLMNASALASYFENSDIDIIKIVPSHWSSLSNGSALLLPRRTIVFGGEVLRPAIVETIKEQAPKVQIVNHYGPTETTIGKLLHRVDLKRSYTSIPIGKPFSNTSIYILDAEQSLLPLGAVGELCIGGAGVARGYLNQAALTEEQFIPNPFQSGERIYRTGDLARWLPDGNVSFIGRRDTQVKIRGFRVELGEIESVLNGLNNIEQSVVLAIEDSSGMKQLVAYIVSKEYGDINSIKEGLILVLEERLPGYMVPNIYVRMEKIPLTINGKIDRKALPIPETFSRQEAYVAPTTAIETQLVAIWQEVLGVEKIGILDNFFDLGGNSLNAIRINAKIRQELDLELEIKNLFHLKTIRDLAFQIDFSEQQKEIKLDNQTLRKIEL